MRGLIGEALAEAVPCRTMCEHAARLVLLSCYQDDGRVQVYKCHGGGARSSTTSLARRARCGVRNCATRHKSLNGIVLINVER